MSYKSHTHEKYEYKHRCHLCKYLAVQAHDPPCVSCSTGHPRGSCYFEPKVEPDMLTSVTALPYGGSDKLPAIKVVRALTGLGLKAGLLIVEQGGELVFSVPQPREVLARFAEVHLACQEHPPYVQELIRQCWLLRKQVRSRDQKIQRIENTVELLRDLVAEAS